MPARTRSFPVTTAEGFNGFSSVVGTFESADGTMHGYLASVSLVPEPSSLALLLFGISGLSVAALRGRFRGAA